MDLDNVLPQPTPLPTSQLSQAGTGRRARRRRQQATTVVDISFKIIAIVDEVRVCACVRAGSRSTRVCGYIRQKYVS